MDDHNLVQALPNIATGIDGGVSQDMVIVATTRHNTVFDQDSVHEAIVLHINDTGFHQHVKGWLVSTGPLVAFQLQNLLPDHRWRHVVVRVNEPGRLAHIATGIFCAPTLLIGLAVSILWINFKGPFKGQSREAWLWAIIRHRHTRGLQQWQFTILNGVCRHTSNDGCSIVMANNVVGVLKHTTVLDVCTEMSR